MRYSWGDGSDWTEETTGKGANPTVEDVRDNIVGHEGSKGLTMYRNAGGGPAYLNDRTKVTVQWFDSEGNALCEPQTINLVWNCTVSNEAPFEVTRVNLNDTRKEGKIDSDAICDKYTVTSEQTAWNKVNVYVSAENLQKHQNGDTPETSGNWIGFGVLAPSSVSATTETVNGNNATVMFSGYEGTLNTKPGNCNTDCTEKGFVEYFDLEDGQAVYTVVVTWTYDTDHTVEITYTVYFDVSFYTAPVTQQADFPVEIDG